MNQGAVQSSAAQQMVPAGGPSWCILNNEIHPPPPPLYQHHFFLAAAEPLPHHDHSPHQLVADVANDDGGQEIAQFLEGVVGDGEDRPAGLRRLENWEQQLLNLTSNVEIHPMVTAASSPKPCVTPLNNNMMDLSPKSSDSKHPHQDPSPECNSSISTTTVGAAKKARIQPPSAQSTFKARKEKLGDRITALHQLVSPFGKTDTASVLLEAIGYIRFLQSQIEALSLPYLTSKSTTIRQHLTELIEEPEADLRSRGLCLVPTSCTLQVGSNNGADYWPAPADFDANFQY